MYYHFKNHCPLMRRGFCGSMLTVRLTQYWLAECHRHVYLVYFPIPTSEKQEYNKIEALRIFVKLFICFLLSPTEIISFQLPNRSPNALAIENSISRKLRKAMERRSVWSACVYKAPNNSPLTSVSAQSNHFSGDKQKGFVIANTGFCVTHARVTVDQYKQISIHTNISRTPGNSFKP